MLSLSIISEKLLILSLIIKLNLLSYEFVFFKLILSSLISEYLTSFKTLFFFKILTDFIELNFSQLFSFIFL